MIRPAKVLIVAPEDDVHAKAVARIIERDHGVEARLFDLEAFPSDCAATAEIGPEYPLEGVRVAYGTHEEDFLAGVTAVWWRRPRPCAVPETPYQSFQRTECDHFMQGLLWSLDASWVNHPAKDRWASRKLVQLKTAHRVGLDVPRTLVTNSPQEAVRFIESTKGNAVIKRIGAAPGPPSKTTLVSDVDPATLDGISASPAIFQEYIRPGLDLRITWIDGHPWTAGIDASSAAYPEDSRYDLSVDYKRYDLPGDVAKRIGQFMEALDLRFGAIDMRVTDSGQHFFLEVNPSGQFVYVQLKTGMPLSEEMASLLVRG